MIKNSELNLGQIEAIVNKIGGMRGVRRLLADELVVVEKSALKAIVTGPLGFRVWRTLALGQHTSPEAYRNALEKAGFRIGEYADQILRKIPIAQTMIQVDLVRITAVELGFKDGARRDAIYARAIKLGLELCPAEVGPALRLLYQEATWIGVGMEPITDDDGDLEVFSVRTDDDGRWLGREYGRPDRFWVGGNQWVFARPRT